MLPAEIQEEEVEISPLSAKENKRRAELEEVIERNFKAFVETGRALAEIRESRLYRSTHTTFYGYCKDLWELSESYSTRLIGASAVIENLLPIGKEIPANEAQARPLAKLKPDQQRTLWEEIVDVSKAKDVKITAALVERIVAKYLGEDTDRKHREIKNRIARAEVFSEEFKSSFAVFLAAVDRARHEKWKSTSREAALKFLDELRAQIMKGY